jgi:hypothetical protein
LEYEDMNDDTTSDRESPAPGSGDRGVFGNLPSERPGVRSPRRGEDKGPKAKPASSKPAAAEKPAEPASAQREAPPPPPPPRERPAPPPASEPEAEAGSGRGSVEEVAWAGITVAAEAATLGVRLVSRALEAVRERR